MNRMSGLAEVISADGYDLWVITILGQTPPRLFCRHASDPGRPIDCLHTRARAGAERSSAVPG